MSRSHRDHTKFPKRVKSKPKVRRLKQKVQQEVVTDYCHSGGY
jgi:hypothetical protein